MEGFISFLLILSPAFAIVVFMHILKIFIDEESKIGKKIYPTLFYVFCLYLLGLMLWAFTSGGPSDISDSWRPSRKW